jgi:hypothetical protein
VARIASLAKNPNETFGDALPLFEYSIVLRLRLKEPAGLVLSPRLSDPAPQPAFNSNLLPTGDLGSSICHPT